MNGWMDGWMDEFKCNSMHFLSWQSTYPGIVFNLEYLSLYPNLSSNIGFSCLRPVYWPCPFPHPELAKEKGSQAHITWMIPFI
jgi:hypothetical protein